jgi:hypothetical protein
MNIGVSLLFSSSEGKKVTGILKSYIISLNRLNVRTIESQCDEKAAGQILLSPSYKYLGIEDVYSVAGSLAPGNVLGRTTYRECKTKHQAKSLIIDKSHYPFYKERLPKNIRYFSVRLVYLYEGVGSNNQKFSFLIITIVKASSHSEAISKSKVFSSSEKLKKLIASCSADELNEDHIQFIGLHDVCPIFDSIRKGGAYQTFYNKNVKGEKALSKLLLTKDEMKKKISVVKEVFQKN